MKEEELIPVNFPTYPFAQEDSILASKILGLSFSHSIMPKPFGPVFDFELNERNSLQNIIDFLATLPDEFELKYFRCFDPIKSVAGTVVIVQKFKNQYLFYNGSHGQDTRWKDTSKDALLHELFVQREYQSFGTVKVCRKNKQAVSGKEAY